MANEILLQIHAMAVLACIAGDYKPRAMYY
jgi:hypothetical protein